MEQYFRKVFQDIYKEEEKVTLHVETIIPEALDCKDKLVLRCSEGFEHLKTQLALFG